MMSKRRVVVTGMGVISPVGNTVTAAWDAVCNGRSGIIVTRPRRGRRNACYSDGNSCNGSNESFLDAQDHE